jgi:hypothetical protein
VLWLIVLGVARSKRRPAAALAVATMVIAASLAFLLFVATEYGGHIRTPLWGIFALLPASPEFPRLRNFSTATDSISSKETRTSAN